MGYFLFCYTNGFSFLSLLFCITRLSERSALRTHHHSSSCGIVSTGAEADSVCLPIVCCRSSGNFPFLSPEKTLNPTWPTPPYSFPRSHISLWQQFLFICLFGWGWDWIHMEPLPLFELLYQSRMIDYDNCKEKTCPNVTSSTTNPTLRDLG
jgi:hypothetical protein